MHQNKNKTVDFYGAFAFRYAPAPIGCTLGEVTVTVDGEPYDPSVEDQFTIQETSLWNGVEEPTVPEGYVVYAIAEDQEALNFTMPYTCDEANVSGVAFDDDNSNGVTDEGEEAVPDVAIMLEGFMGLYLNETVYEVLDDAGLDEVSGWYSHDLTTDENGAYSQALLQNWAEPFGPALDPADRSQYVAWVTPLDGCIVAAQDTITPESFIGDVEDFMELWVVGDGPWEIRDKTINTDAIGFPFDAVWGESDIIDIPLDCQDAPPVDPPQ